MANSTAESGTVVLISATSIDALGNFVSNFILRMYCNTPVSQQHFPQTLTKPCGNATIVGNATVIVVNVCCSLCCCESYGLRFSQYNFEDVAPGCPTPSTD